jgi:hypothetical protein
VNEEAQKDRYPEMIVQEASQSDRKPTYGERPTEVGSQGASVYEPENCQEEYENNTDAASPRCGHRVRTTRIRNIQDPSP